MKTWRQSLHILRVMLRHRLDRLVAPDLIPKSAPRFFLKCWQAVTPEPRVPRGERVRAAFLDLGPVYIKLGQLLSTRRDLIPADVADALATLQDQVPPIVDFDVHRFVTETLDKEAAEVFAHLEADPLASASIAQVHAARLISGDEVVVKLVRPGIRQRISADMALLKALGAWLHEHIPQARRLQLPRVTADHEQVLLAELDMFNEARNQIQLRRNFAESELLYVPKVHAEYTRDRLLVMERVYGVPIGQVETLKAKGVDMRVLAHKGVETFFKQVFEHNFFHADMHPGNILIDTTDPSDPKYIALDCAIIGSLTSDDQNYLAQNLLAFFNRDYRQVVELHLQSGWVPADTDVDAFEAVIREVCEPIFAKPLAEISFAEFVVTLLDTAGQFDMQVQPQLVLLQKTLLYIEGLGRQLYPQLDLWETAQPFMERWANERLGPAAVITDWLSAGPELWQQLSRLPMTLRNSEAELRHVRSQLTRQHDSIERMARDLHQHRRARRFKQAAGVGFIGLSMWMLWQPLAEGLSSGDATMLAGVVSAFLGSALLVRA